MFYKLKNVLSVKIV